MRSQFRKKTQKNPDDQNIKIQRYKEQISTQANLLEAEFSQETRDVQGDQQSLLKNHEFHVKIRPQKNRIEEESEEARKEEEEGKEGRDGGRKGGRKDDGGRKEEGGGGGRKKEGDMAMIGRKENGIGR